VSDPIAFTEIAAQGLWGTVEYVAEKLDKIEAKSFLVSRERKILAKFLVLFAQVANGGPASLPNKRFKKEMDELWAFKWEFKKVQYRLPCFLDGNKCVITHGFVKPGAQKGMGEWPNAEIERANRLKEWYFEAKKASLKRKK
jgi:hypothetical protein